MKYKIKFNNGIIKCIGIFYKIIYAIIYCDSENTSIINKFCIQIIKNTENKNTF